MYRSASVTHVEPTAYVPLLETIAKGESNGNYNAYYGSTSNGTVEFTKMTVEEVLRWQDEYVKQGSPSSAVGKYQIIQPTLKGLIKELDINPTTIFDPATQDRLAIQLIERRGSLKFVNNKLTREQFAFELSKEWAALPRSKKPNATESYYAGDGLNKSRVTVNEVYVALRPLETIRN